jgi:hypothetical protein
MNLVSLAELIGPSPPRCPLNPTVLSAVDCGVYVRQTVEYAVEEAERIKSLLLLPKNTGGTAPAVIAHHQHAGQFDLGKSEVVGLAGDADQAYGAELAERGYVVIAPDALAFEERNWSAIAGQAEYYELASRLPATTARPSTGANPNRSALHSVCIGFPPGPALHNKAINSVPLLCNPRFCTKMG